MGIPCYVSDTLIRTDKGEVAVEALQKGDKVATAEGRFEPILWLDKTVISLPHLQAFPHLRPVRIKPGAFGNKTALFVHGD